jgi:hypothetical protein
MPVNFLNNLIIVREETSLNPVDKQTNKQLKQQGNAQQRKNYLKMQLVHKKSMKLFKLLLNLTLGK